MSSRSASVPMAKRYQPNDLEALSDQIAQTFECIRIHELNRVFSGLIVNVASTPSAQLTGVGNTTWSFNISSGLVSVDGSVGSVAALVDEAIHAGSFLTGLTSGKSCIAAIVAKNDAGTISVVSVKGTPATTGSQKRPTDAEIQTVVGTGLHWVKLAECTLNRTGDTMVTEAFDNGVRPILGVNAAYAMGDL